MPPKEKKEKLTQGASQAKKNNEKKAKVSSVVEKEAGKVVVKTEPALTRKKKSGAVAQQSMQALLDPATAARRAANAGGVQVSETQEPSRAYHDKYIPVARWQHKLKQKGPGTMDITQLLKKVEPQYMSVHRNKIQGMEKQRKKELLKDNKMEPAPRDVDRKKDERIVKNALKVKKKAQMPAKNSFIGKGYEAFPIGSVAKRGPIASSKPSQTQTATQVAIESFDQYATQVATEPEVSQMKKARKS